MSPHYERRQSSTPRIRRARVGMPRLAALVVLVTGLAAASLIGTRAEAQPTPATPTPTPTVAPTAPPIAKTAAPKPAGPVKATASRGVASEFTFEHAGPILRAKPNQALTSPILVRLTLMDSAETVKPGAPRKYKLSFIGNIAGTFDLRDYLERADGQAVTDVPSIIVAVESHLPEKHGTDLFTVKHPPFLLQSQYQLLLYAFAGLWIAIPAIVIVRRMLKKRAEVPPPVLPPPPTLAEQLRPLVEAAASRELSIAEQGRLELLLISFWRERLGLGSLTPAQAISRIRQDPTAGRLLVAVERWLHSRDAGHARPGDEIAALLEPYRGMPAVDVNVSTPRGAEVART